MAPLGIGDWSFNTFLMCFAGGILGTTLGGLYAFVICGLLVLLGCISVLGGVSASAPYSAPMSADLPPVSQRSPMRLKSRKTWPIQR